MIAFSDADWAFYRSDRRSTSEFVLILNGGVLYWSSRKRRCVALCSTESKDGALAECTKAIVRWRRILSELNGRLGCATILGDNKSCMIWAVYGVKRKKHIEVQHQYAGKILESGIVSPKYRDICGRTDKCTGEIQVQAAGLYVSIDGEFFSQLR